jgi:hypothetical protein
MHEYVDKLVLASMTCHALYPNEPECDGKYNWNGEYESRADFRDEDFQDEFEFYVNEIVEELDAEEDKAKEEYDL